MHGQPKLGLQGLHHAPGLAAIQHMPVTLHPAMLECESHQPLRDPALGHAVKGMTGQAHENSPWQPGNRVASGRFEQGGVSMHETERRKRSLSHMLYIHTVMSRDQQVTPTL